MSEVYTIVFFGHRYVEHLSTAEEKLYGLISERMRLHEYVEFLMGRDGEFDLLAASVVKKALRESPGSGSLIWVLPYETAEFRNHAEDYLKYYDEVEICEQSAAVHPKSAFRIRNRTMIDRADEAIFYMNRQTGGAYAAYQYAVSIGKKIYNIADP